MLRRGAPTLSIKRTLQMPVYTSLARCKNGKSQRSNSFVIEVLQGYLADVQESKCLQDDYHVSSLSQQSAVYTPTCLGSCISEHAVKISPINPSPLRAGGTNSKFGATALSIGRSCTAVPFRPSVLAFV